MNSSKSILPRCRKLIEDLVTYLQPTKIVEFGPWKGQSAVGFLLLARANGSFPQMLCVDTWLGSNEHWSSRQIEGEWGYQALGVHNGEPSILEEFWGVGEQISIF